MVTAGTKVPKGSMVIANGGIKAATRNLFCKEGLQRKSCAQQWPRQMITPHAGQDKTVAEVNTTVSCWRQQQSCLTLHEGLASVVVIALHTSSFASPPCETNFQSRPVYRHLLSPWKLSAWCQQECLDVVTILCCSPNRSCSLWGFLCTATLAAVFAEQGQMAHQSYRYTES